MKRLLLNTIMLMVCQAVFAPITFAKNEKTTSLELGRVTVWLGMPKQEAIRSFSRPPYIVMENGDGVTVVDPNRKHTFVLKFQANRLVFADRAWYTSDVSEIDAVLGALTAVLGSGDGSGRCLVAHDVLSQPDPSSERVFVFCGDRSVLIQKGKLNGKPFVDVSERIGTIPHSP